MIFKVPERPDVPCAKCGAMNDDQRFYLWRVADGRGPWRECIVCAHVEPVDPGAGVVPVRVADAAADPRG